MPGTGDARVGTVMELAGEFHRVGFLSGLAARPLGDAAQVQRFASEAGRRFLILTASDRATLDLASSGGVQVLARGDDVDRSPARLDAFRRTPRVREVLLLEVVAPDDQSPSPSQDE